MVQLSTPWVTPNRGMGPPWGAFCQITLTSCLKLIDMSNQYSSRLQICKRFSILDTVRAINRISSGYMYACSAVFPLTKRTIFLRGAEQILRRWNCVCAWLPPLSEYHLPVNSTRRFVSYCISLHFIETVWFCLLKTLQSEKNRCFCVCSDLKPENILFDAQVLRACLFV